MVGTRNRMKQKETIRIKNASVGCGRGKRRFGNEKLLSGSLFLFPRRLGLAYIQQCSFFLFSRFLFQPSRIRRKTMPFVIFFFYR